MRPRPLQALALTGRSDRHVLESLQRITDATLAFLGEEDLLHELMQRISEVLSVDTVAFLMLEGDTLHARAAKGIEEEVEQGVRIPVGRGFAGRIAAERRAIAITDVDHADILNPILREKGIQSLLGVPLLVEGAVIGVLHVGSLTPREFTADERDLLQLAADRAALALEQTRLFRQERVARESAEAATQRLESLQLITDATLAYLGEEDLLHELLQRVSNILAADTVAILMLEGDTLHARAAKGIEEEVEQGVRIPVGRGFAGRIAAERRAIAITDVDHADILNPILREKGIQSLLGVPLLVEGAVIGVLHVGSLTPREFTADEHDLLQLAADRAALALEHARLYEQRRVAEVLQRRLLPVEIGDGFGIEAAARYLPASGGSLGGDWYDVFALAGGRVGIAVGDVVGHGVEAAAIMAQLRTAVRAYAADGHPADAVVDRVNSLMVNLGPLGHDDPCVHGDRPGARDTRGGQRRPSAAADHRPVRLRRVPVAEERRAARRRAARRSTARRRSRSRPARPCSPTPTVSWSAAASRSTSGSSACERSPRARPTSTRCAGRSSRSSCRTPRTTTSRSSPRACRRWATT